MKIQIRKLRENAIIPKYQTAGSAGFDIHALIDNEVTIIPKSQYVIPTGLAFSIPFGYELQTRPRSGLAKNKCITITNSPGTLDSDYLDELFIILYNLGEENFIVKHGDRIAQCVLKQVEQAEFEIVTDFDNETKQKNRGGGLGSTGI